MLPVRNEAAVVEIRCNAPLRKEDEFSGELTHINPILLEIKEADFDLEEEIRFVENLLYDNSSPRPPEELNAKISNTIVESLCNAPLRKEDVMSKSWRNIKA
nr:hypothetical protein [Tanacetum cinerariifolium]